MRRILFVTVISLVLFSHYSQAEHVVQPVVVNASGTTISGAGKNIINSVGESVIGQTWGEGFSIQTGFFNEYFILPPTPTVTPTITVTSTPIRTFNGEIISKKWVYAAPNPIRGSIAHIYFHLARAADIEIKVYTTSSQLVISKRWDMKPAGKNYWRWHMSNLANGVYIMRVKAKGADGRTTIVKKKIVLVK